MRHKDLPERWKNRITTYIAEVRPLGPQTLSASDFAQNLRMRFPDGSFAQFNFAFTLVLDSEIAVFTEHCGYHIFPFYDVEITPVGEQMRYGGMSVNERLLAANLLTDFDDAARTRKRDTMIELLSRVEMTPRQCEETADAILANPERYGY